MYKICPEVKPVQLSVNCSALLSSVCNNSWKQHHDTSLYPTQLPAAQLHSFYVFIVHWTPQCTTIDRMFPCKSIDFCLFKCLLNLKYMNLL